MMRAVFRAMAFANANHQDTVQILANWLKVDRGIAAGSYDLGKNSWSAGGVVSDAAVKILVDQSMAELKSKDNIPLDRVRNWSFAERAHREITASRAR